MKKIHRGWKFNKATTQEKLLALAGVPPENWKPISGDVVFSNMSYSHYRGSSTITDKEQQEWFNLLMDPDELLKGRLVLIGCPGHDTHALHVAVDMVRPIMDQAAESGVATKKVRFTDLSQVPDFDTSMPDGTRGSRWWWEGKETAVHVIHNITEECTPGRLQKCRDVIRAFHLSTRIVVIAGADPIEFALDVLRVKPEVCLYMDRISVKVSR